MKRLYGISLIALLCTLPSAHAFQGCRSVSPGEKYYNAIRVELTQKIESKKLRNTLIATSQSVSRYHKHHTQAQGFGFMPKIKHACTLSNDHAAQLHTFLKRKNALKNRSHYKAQTQDETDSQALIPDSLLRWAKTPKNRSHEKAPSWTETYDEAKIAALIPFMIHTKAQELHHEDPTKTIRMLLKAFATFDLTANDLQTELKNKKAKLFKNIGDDEDHKRDQFAHNRLSAVSKLLASAQVHSKQVQEALNAVEKARSTHETQVGYGLLATLLAGGLYVFYNAMAHHHNNQLLEES